MAAHMAARWLVLLALLPCLVALPAPAGAQAGVTPHLVSLSAGYGSEAWKDEPAVAGMVVRGLPLPAPPPGALGVYSNPYANATPHQGPLTWLGYNLTATLELRDAGGRPEASPTYLLAARLETSLGSVPAKLARIGPGRFTAQFDLDGAADASFPAAPPGAARILVEVYQSGSDPTVAAARVATAEFTVQVQGASLDRGGFLLAEGALPGYRDVGAGNETLVQAELARPGEGFTVTASLGIADAPAAIVAWHRSQGSVLAQGRTDAEGRFGASVDSSQLTGGNRSGMAIVAAYLDGSKGRLASALLAVPVSSHLTRVVRYLYEDRALPGQDVEAVDTLLVTLEDLSAGMERPVRGTLYALDTSGEELAAVPFEPASFAPTRTDRTARIPALELQSANLTSYRVLALLLTEDGRLYSMAQGVRGYALGGGSALARAFERGELPVVVRNFNNNLDDQRDPGMALPVRVRVEGLPGGGVHETDITVEESGEARLAVPFSGDAGSYNVLVNTTSGELEQQLRGLVRIQAAEQGFLGLPGPEAPLAVLLMAGAALAYRRRHSS